MPLNSHRASLYSLVESNQTIMGNDSDERETAHQSVIGIYEDRSVVAPSVPLTCGIVGVGLGFLHHCYYHKLTTKLATLASSSLPIDQSTCAGFERCMTLDERNCQPTEGPIF
jgi:hypothetical protein